MSRVEEFFISRNFPESGVEPTRRMTAHIDRRGKGRVKVVGEISPSNPKINPERATSKRENSPEDKKIQIIFQWPLGSERKRY